MEFAEKEHQKMSKKIPEIKKKLAEPPVWFNKKIDEEMLTKDEEEELKDLLKEFK